MSTEAGEKLRERALKFFPTTGGTPVDIMTAFCRAELEKAAEIADYAKRTFDDSDDEYGFTRSALDRVLAAIRQRML